MTLSKLCEANRLRNKVGYIRFFAKEVLKLFIDDHVIYITTCFKSNYPAVNTVKLFREQLF